MNIIISSMLEKYFNESEDVLELGVDEAGRGPLLGRVYTAAVILPKDDSFDHSKMKDSKKFSSKKKIREVAEYIKKNAIAYAITFSDEKKIDEINILQATMDSMKRSILETISKSQEKYKDSNIEYKYELLIDGNYFKPVFSYNPTTKMMDHYRYMCVEKGDATYSSIAAASILAKVARDDYIAELCQQYPDLSTKYGIDTNMGYGAKKHMDGIKEHGITQFHRKSFKPCKI
jgi:ribonuclease HII